jgi:hypothetical protein
MSVLFFGKFYPGICLVSSSHQYFSVLSAPADQVRRACVMLPPAPDSAFGSQETITANMYARLGCSQFHDVLFILRDCFSACLLLSPGSTAVLQLLESVFFLRLIQLLSTPGPAAARYPHHP